MDEKFSHSEDENKGERVKVPIKNPRELIHAKITREIPSALA